MVLCERIPAKLGKSPMEWQEGLREALSFLPSSFLHASTFAYTNADSFCTRASTAILIEPSTQQKYFG